MKTLFHAYIKALVYIALFIFANSAGATTYYVSSQGDDANDGILTSNGGSGPWLTIQKAARTMVAGDVTVVSGGVYFEPEPVSGSTKWYGIRPKNSGTPDSPITFKAASDAAVIIDQQGQSPCITIEGKSNIVIEGFELRNCMTAGVWVKSGQGFMENISVIDNHIHTIDGLAGQNVAGVRADDVKNILIRINKIHNVSVNGDKTNGNAAAILSYKAYELIIENNDFSDTNAGFFHKYPPSQEQSGAVVRNNIFSDLNHALYYNSNSTATGPHKDVQIHNNLFINCNEALHDNTHLTSHASTGLDFFNNTLIEVGFNVRGFKNVTAFNNIFYSAGSIDLLSTTYQDGTSNPPNINFVDHNLYYPNFKGQTGRYSSNNTKYDTLYSWQNFFDSSTISHVAPDANSLTSDPLFVAASNDNYRLSASSPAKQAGKDGGYIGAYDGGNIVGLISTSPKPPSGLTAN